ncbi:MAG: FAD binding domain-containing protein [Rhodospirillales bacterium]|nr:FAD binding domain-containing protein [Rhodospirillales bacterium]
MGAYLRPASIDEALDRLSTGGWKVVAGCTDYYCRPDAQPLADHVLDLTGLSEARGIVDDGKLFRLGALTTWAELAAAHLPPQFDALRDAARHIGGIQIQNTGSIGGNLCNASPAADGVPPLLIMDAAVELRSLFGARVLPLTEFILDSRQTALRPEELLTAILLPKRRGRHASRFRKLGARSYQVISIVMVAALLETDDTGRIAEAAVAVGSCSSVALRLSALEHALIGRDVAGRPLSTLLDAKHFAQLKPVSDVRGTAEYRRDAARLLVGRALEEVQERLQ